MAPLLAALAWLAAAARAEPADLILRGGKIVVAPGRYVTSVAVRGNRIEGLGDAKQIMALKGPQTRVVDLKGRLVVPGFHDARARVVSGALSLTRLDVSGGLPLADVQKRVAAFAESYTDDDWIIGSGWDDALLPKGALPLRYQLDEAVSTRPVALTDLGGRRIWLNSEGLRRAGITRSLSGLPKGAILRDKDDEPTGIVSGEALPIVRKAFPKVDRATKLAALRRVLPLFRKLGITAIDSFPDDQSSPEEQLGLWRELFKNDEATTRLVLFGRLEDLPAYAKLRVQARDLPRTRVLLPGVSAAVDGDLASRRAALFEPYFDAPEARPRTLLSQGSLDSLVRAAHEQGYQVALEASGDRAARMALDACEKSQLRARAESRTLPPYPCRIDGPALLSLDDMPRFRVLHAGVELQLSALGFQDGVQNFVPNRLGDRVKRAYPARSLEEAGAKLIFGSGWPAGALDPRIALNAAVTRRFLDGRPEKGWVPEQKIGAETALAHAGGDAWEVAGQGDELGDVLLGRVADLVVLDRDALADDADLSGMQVDLTVFDGRVVYERLPSAKKKAP